MTQFKQALNEINWSLPVGIHCIDDRGYQDAGQNLKLGGASSYGLAYDTYAARAMSRGGTSEVQQPVGEAAKVITKGLARYALLANIHHECAAEAGVLAIADQIVTNGEFVLSETNRILDGSVDESKFEQLQNFYAQLRDTTALFRGVEHEAACMESDDSYPGIPRAHLAHTDHNASWLGVNTQENTWHDASLAYANGQPSYGYDVWAIPPVAEKVDTIMPHDNVEGFVVASIARVVATSLLLPHDEGRSGVDIVIC